MGMVELTTKLLMEQARFNDFSKYHLLTIGRQGIAFPVRELRKWAREFNFTLVESNLQRALTENRSLTDTEYFLALGFKSVDSMDVSEYEQASIICNLNEDIPPELYDRFDVIYDGGSTEHMFNVPKAFENYNKMLRNGGFIMHSLPSTGNLDHGFYMFSPTLFHDYYSQNKWDIKTSYMLQVPYDNMDSWNIYEYSEPGPFLEHIEFKGRWGIFFVAQKKTESAYSNNISQNYFRKLWQVGTINKDTSDILNPENVSVARKLFRMLPENVKTLIRSLVYGKSKLPFSKPKIPFKKLYLK